MRARGVAALAAQQHLEVVGRAGERAHAEPDRADVDPGVGVQAEDPRDTVEAPASIAISAPPGMTSSAGWKISRTRPGSASATSASARPAPSRAVACTSWPQACATPGDRAHPGVVGEVVDGERVQVGTQGHQRTVTGADVDRRARCAAAATGPAGLVEPLGEHGRGALLGPGELRVRVQVAAYLDQLLRVCLHAGQHGPEQAVPVGDRPRGGRRGSRGHEDQAYPQGAPVPDRSVVRRCCRPATGPR